MEIDALLRELFGRIPPLARDAADDLPAEYLVEPPRPGANTIAWLLWHLARVEDSHIAEVIGQEQVWTTDDWAARFGRPADPSDTGFGHDAEEVLRIRPSDDDVLLDYLDAVHATTTTWLEGLVAADLDRVVDRDWDPPVTLGVRLVSVADDCLQHVGQARYVRGLLQP